MIISLLLLFAIKPGWVPGIFAIRQHEIKEKQTTPPRRFTPHALDVVEADRYQADIEWEEEGQEFYLRTALRCGIHSKR